MPARLDEARWRVVLPYLDHALELTGAARTDWIAALRDQDAALAADVAALLARDEALEQQGFLASAPAAAFLQGSLVGQQVGAYELHSQLGQGGMGSVWLALRSDGQFEGEAAVKLLNASLVGQEGEARFSREAGILARLRHAHIAQLFDAGVSPVGQPYLILERVRGTRIDHYCDEHRLDVVARVRLFLDVLSAVAHAHANLVVHRDLKPSNVMVDVEGRVKLLDFGIAKLLLGETDGVTALTREGHAALTPEFAAPEQFTGGAITTATDVYALGVLLFLLLAGRHPVSEGASSPAALIRAVVEAEPERLSEAGEMPPAELAAGRGTTPRKLRSALRGDLENIVAKALKKLPAERYASAEAMADDLRRYLERRPVRARADSLAYRTRKFVARNRMALGAGAVAGLALVSGTVVALWQAREAARARDRALVQLHRAEATNDLTGYLLSEATPSLGRPITNAELLARGEAHVDRRFESEPGLRVHMLLTLAERHHENDQFDRWQATVERAFSLSRGLADVALRSRAACVRAAAVDDQGHVAEGDALLAQALRDLATLPDSAADEAYCRVCEANMANRRAEPARAVAAAERAVALEQGRSGPAGRGFEALFLLGNAYIGAERYAEADQTFGKLATMLEQQARGDTRDMARLLNNWSALLQQAGQHLRAVGLSERAVRIARERDSEHGATQAELRSLANALCVVGRCAEAVPVADEALAKARESVSPRRLYGALGIATAVQLETGGLARAAQLLAEAERTLAANEAEMPGSRGVLERRLAQLALLRGDHRAGLTLAQRAAERYDDVQALLVLAKAQSAHGSFAAARQTAEKALGLASAVSVPECSAWTGQARLELGVALAGAGDADAARGELRHALAQLDACLGPAAASTRSARAELERLGR